MKQTVHIVTIAFKLRKLASTLSFMLSFFLSDTFSYTALRRDSSLAKTPSAVDCSICFRCCCLRNMSHVIFLLFTLVLPDLFYAFFFSFVFERMLRCSSMRLARAIISKTLLSTHCGFSHILKDNIFLFAILRDKTKIRSSGTPGYSGSILDSCGSLICALI